MTAKAKRTKSVSTKRFRFYYENERTGKIHSRVILAAEDDVAQGVFPPAPPGATRDGYFGAEPVDPAPKRTKSSPTKKGNSDEKPVWIVRTVNVGPNMNEPDVFTGDHYEIVDSPPLTNSSREEKEEGWLGTSGDYYEYAEGRFPSRAAAVKWLNKRAWHGYNEIEEVWWMHDPEIQYADVDVWFFGESVTSYVDENGATMSEIEEIAGKLEDEAWEEGWSIDGIDDWLLRGMEEEGIPVLPETSAVRKESAATGKNENREMVNRINEIIKGLADDLGLDVKKIPEFSKIFSILIPGFDRDRVSVGFKRTNLGTYTLSITDGIFIVKERVSIEKLDYYLRDHVSTILEQIKLREEALELVGEKPAMPEDSPHDLNDDVIIHRNELRPGSKKIASKKPGKLVVLLKHVPARDAQFCFGGNCYVLHGVVNVAKANAWFEQHDGKNVSTMPLAELRKRIGSKADYYARKAKLREHASKRSKSTTTKPRIEKMSKTQKIQEIKSMIRAGKSDDEIEAQFPGTNVRYFRESVREDDLIEKLKRRGMDGKGIPVR